MEKQEYLSEEAEAVFDPMQIVEDKMDELGISDDHRDLCRAVAVAVMAEKIEEGALKLDSVTGFKAKLSNKGGLVMVLVHKSQQTVVVGS